VYHTFSLQKTCGIDAENPSPTFLQSSCKGGKLKEKNNLEDILMERSFHPLGLQMAASLCSLM